jgi:hypothetical protein
VIAFSGIPGLEISGGMNVFHEANRRQGQTLYGICVVAETADPAESHDRLSTNASDHWQRERPPKPEVSEAFSVTGERRRK